MSVSHLFSLLSPFQPPRDYLFLPPRRSTGEQQQWRGGDWRSARAIWRRSSGRRALCLCLPVVYPLALRSLPSGAKKTGDAGVTGCFLKEFPLVREAPSTWVSFFWEKVLVRCREVPKIFERGSVQSAVMGLATEDMHFSELHRHGNAGFWKRYYKTTLKYFITQMHTIRTKSSVATPNQRCGFSNPLDSERPLVPTQAQSVVESGNALRLGKVTRKPCVVPLSSKSS